ncbi:MAG: hypothetical protein KW788_01555 [Candidatus Doudnabacteria bacterium]|nr:hypothetical protein [Candidatus Doudnabacteria bacterium]
MDNEKRLDLQLPGGMVVVGVTEKEADVLRARHAFVEQYCRGKGWDMLNLTIDQLLEVRAQPGWKNP